MALQRRAALVGGDRLVELDPARFEPSHDLLELLNASSKLIAAIFGGETVSAI